MNDTDLVHSVQECVLHICISLRHSHRFQAHMEKRPDIFFLQFETWWDKSHLLQKSQMPPLVSLSGMIYLPRNDNHGEDEHIYGCE